jgi:hypothetical protein
VAFIGFWIGIHGRAANVVAREMGVQLLPNPTDKHHLELPASCLVLKNEWNAFVFREGGEPLIEDHSLSQLSRGGRLVMALADEYSMRSEVHHWINGQKLWSVLHDAQTGDHNHLLVDGERLPKSLEGHQNKALAKHGSNPDVDHVFDVPHYLARELTGFKYDSSDPPSGTLCYEVTAAQGLKDSLLGRASRPWWKFW